MTDNLYGEEYQSPRIETLEEGTFANTDINDNAVQTDSIINKQPSDYKKYLYREIEFAVDVEDRVIYLCGEIEDYALYDFMSRCRTIMKFHAGTDKEFEPLNLVIDSNGGDVFEMFGIIDYMESLDKNLGIKMNTMCRGKALSAAAVILAAGTGKRMASRRSTIMLHEGSSMASGKQSDVQAAGKYFDYLNNMANDLLEAKTHKDKKFWDANIKTDMYLNSKDALKLGVIDIIIT
jgi:ATP-dependent Clp protease protease subunit|tara:strand:- start:379 stop:1083 length:705 start_codon:yes stop_codon:yes gene_type:complete